MIRLMFLALFSSAVGDVAAQDVKLVSQSSRVASKGFSLLSNPFQELDRLGSDHGFQNAGAREVRPIPGGRRRLSYTLSRSSEAASLEEFVEARPTFRDRWLAAELAVRFDGIAPPEIVDEAHRRSREDVQTTVVTRRIEVRGEEESVAKAERFLDAVVQQNQKMVMADTWIIQTEAEASTAAGEARVALVDARAFDRRLAAAKEGPVDILASPSVAVLGGQSATISVVNQVSYLADFEFETVGEALIADPIIGVVHEGLLIGLTPIFGPDGKTISIGASLTISNLKRPINELTLKLPKLTGMAATPTISKDKKSVRGMKDGHEVGLGNAEVTIQLPETSITRWSSEEIRLGDGDAGFHVTGLRGNRWSESGELSAFDLEILVRVRVQDPEDLVAKAKPIAEILGFDPVAGRAFALFADGVDPAEWSGRTVRVMRGDESVAQGSIANVKGAIAIVVIEEGVPVEGDWIAP